MTSRFSAFVFRNRKFFSTGVLIFLIVLKICLRGTTSLSLIIIGAAIIGAGIAFRMYSASYLWGKHIVTEIEAEFFCTSGPFAYMKNPLYFGNFIIGLGACVAFNEWYGYTVFLAEYAFRYSVVTSYEEKYMQDKFGDDYAEYKAQTRRFLPKLKAYKGGKKTTPNYKLGAWSEKYHVLILLTSLIIFYIFFVE